MSPSDGAAVHPMCRTGPLTSPAASGQSPLPMPRSGQVMLLLLLTFPLAGCDSSESPSAAPSDTSAPDSALSRCRDAAETLGVKPLEVAYVDGVALQPGQPTGLECSITVDNGGLITVFVGSDGHAAVVDLNTSTP